MKYLILSKHYSLSRSCWKIHVVDFYSMEVLLNFTVCNFGVCPDSYFKRQLLALLAKTVATAAVLHRSKVPTIIKSFNKFYLNHIFKTMWILKQFHIWEKSTLLKFQTYKTFKALVCLNTVSYLHLWDVFTGIKINTVVKN